MNAEIEEIKRQLHELRNYLGPVEMILANIEAQIRKDRAALEGRIAKLELRLDDLVKQADCRKEQSTETSQSPTRLAPDGPPPGASV